MKKLSFTLSMAICLMGFLLISSFKSNSAPSPVPLKVQAGIYFDLWGVIGDDATAHMEMNGMKGTFEYASHSIQRKLTFKSYNAKTGRLIINEYSLKGAYIGFFSGTYFAKRGSYRGVFKNTKGYKTEFSLFDSWD